MSDLPLTTILSVGVLVPSIIALVQTVDRLSRILAGALVALSTWLALLPYVSFIRDMTSGTFLTVLTVLIAVLAIVAAMRFKHPVIGSIIVTCGLLLALRALGIVS